MMWSTEYVKSANKTKTQKYTILHTLWFIFCAFWPLLLFRFNNSWGLHLTRRETAAKTSNFKQEGKHNRMKRAQNNLKDERSKTKTTDERIHLTELFSRCRASVAVKKMLSEHWRLIVSQQRIIETQTKMSQRQLGMEYSESERGNMGKKSY